MARYSVWQRRRWAEGHPHEPRAELTSLAPTDTGAVLLCYIDPLLLLLCVCGVAVLRLCGQLLSNCHAHQASAFFVDGVVEVTWFHE